ncbi:ABC transporter substrate-binding protein [Thalassotalea sp. 42_200_T64]|nr:ABC transporter substrate-binding protein [Thalassotalea sp. 42_200_T64]
MEFFTHLICTKVIANEADSFPIVNIGVLKYGTVNWEMAVIKHHQLDKKYQFDLKVTSLSSKNASAVALQSKAVDIILSDWFWVNRQRFNNKNFTLFPTTIAAGGLYIPGDSKARSLLDLNQVKIGIAGGTVDKNWLLLQAYAQQKYQININEKNEIVFASPPLLNRFMQKGDLGAAINFWHYSARLQADGFKILVSVSQMLTELGVDNNLPLLGWVFDQTWAANNNQAVTGFIQASIEAKKILLSSDEEWLRIKPLTKAENNQVFTALKNGYREIILQKFGPDEIQASKKVFTILAKQGGQALVGKATTLDKKTFWHNSKVNLALSKNINMLDSDQ